jgi:hypothetical protein
LKGIVNNATNLILNQVESLQKNAIILADKALASSTPGSVINEAFLNLKQELVRAVIDFQSKSESGILQLIRNSLVFHTGKLTGNKIEHLYMEAGEIITSRINQITYVVNRALNFQ